MATSKATSGFGATLARGDGGVGAGTQATKTIGTVNQQLKLLAKQAGTAGNTKTFGITVSGTASYSQTVSQNAVAIVSASTSGTATTTVAEAIAALYADSTFAKYWQANVGTGNGSGVLVAGASAVLSGGVAGTEIFTPISECRNINGPSRSKAIYEVTHMLSPNNYREFRGSLIDGGELSFDANFINDAGQLALLDDFETADSVSNYQLTFTTEDDGTVIWQFPGILNTFGNNFQMEAAIGLACAMKITGPIVDVTP